MLEYLTKEDLTEGVVDVVDVIGMDAFKSLVKFAGGSQTELLLRSLMFIKRTQ